MYNNHINKAYNEANKLIEKLKNNKDNLQNFTDKYFRIMRGDDE